uniref:Uncharacterized protein n=1 Tax=Rhizophora mucronata TaxID=61149 RepID=A0A2P2P4Y5_RHIMU
MLYHAFQYFVVDILHLCTNYKITEKLTKKTIPYPELA